LHCDGNEDCAMGETCRHSLGESEYFLCSTVVGAIPCSSPADCPGADPMCRNVATNVGNLGWQPRHCAN
jgi:hypothetical protein